MLVVVDDGPDPAVEDPSSSSCPIHSGIQLKFVRGFIVTVASATKLPSDRSDENTASLASVESCHRHGQDGRRTSVEINLKLLGRIPEDLNTGTKT